MSRLRIAMRCMIATLAAATLVAGLFGTASAQDYRDRRPPPPRHYRHRPPPPPAWGYDQPAYVAAPPPVVYAPEGPPAAINFSLNLR
jgi:hypothetical protein